MTLEAITKQIESELFDQLNSCRLMFRLFSRTKTEASVAHKMQLKGDSYRNGHKMQDIIGLRIVVYFSDDVEIAELFFNGHQVVDRSIDSPDSCTFQPQRLNIVCNIPQHLIQDFRAALPSQYAPFIDNTYEVQIRTIFSEGWHEVEHDLRYKCKEDWVGFENYSRTLNGVIASLENSEYSMQSIFRDMAQRCFLNGNYSAMLRNKLRIRLSGNGLSPALTTYLHDHPEVAKMAHEMDRTVLLLTLACHSRHLHIDYDTILFLINRLEIHDAELMKLEPAETTQQLTEFFKERALSC
ncbi:MAG: GTP pyrophosphokinase [Bacteroidaceae bacterium]|nr:GTP pyrophosphokinase [Bacteroidaceae bacterium]